MRTSFSVLAISAVTAVSAQRKVYSAADINVANVNLQTRASWCTGERNVCNVLCNRATANECDPATLNYTCTCSNGTAPGLEYYEQTLPTFICNQAFEDCIAANVGNARGQTNCTDSIKSQCGTIDAQADSAASSTTTSAAATGTGSGSTTGTGTGPRPPPPPAHPVTPPLPPLPAMAMLPLLLRLQWLRLEYEASLQPLSLLCIHLPYYPIPRACHAAP
uniref:Pci domain-containing protein n=1 Tax=Colletotrichum fructicola (strain Nara gc5) TaxID=1213859 RepID=L2GBF6_COLFN